MAAMKSYASAIGLLFGLAMLADPACIKALTRIADSRQSGGPLWFGSFGMK